jgi:glycosyltransferase involved in cell wall biosynthesis
VSERSAEVAFVIQRYGPEITGGSESLARAVAERLLPDYGVTVFTSCARDYVTWRNELPAGESSVEGVRVRRFPVDEERDLDAFNRYSDDLYARPHTREEEIEWLRRQGPVVPGLVDELQRAHDQFRAVLFFTYLYYPTWWGMEKAPARSLLVPTTHDEPPLRLAIYDELFARARGFAFLTPPEEALVRARFGTGDRPAEVAGMGIDAPVDVDPGAFARRHGLAGPYLLYAGRIDAGKGCAAMLAHYARFRAEGGQAELVLIGTLAMALPDTPGVRYLGFLSELEKTEAMTGASVLLCSSPYESLSIVLLEGFAVGTPALVNARSPVLADHCVRSNGGLFYQDEDEFVEALQLLMKDEALRRALGTSGRRYVSEQYAWSAVMGRYRRLIEAVAGAG